MVERRLIAVEGIVQGVGFRPYVHRLASANHLRGLVRNGAVGVLIDIEGESDGLAAFCRALTRELPPLASVSRVSVQHAPPLSYDDFLIADSETSPNTPATPPVSPDGATCAACLAELFDPTNRRYRHPFITCTDCGPRYTMVRDLPYDRVRTTMASFPMCDDCRREYRDPADRRFHAEAIACWSCGPRLHAQAPGVEMAHDQQALDAAIAVLRAGGILALKALGGFHLACAATNSDAVGRLRARKGRDAKPFAVMVTNPAAADAQCVLSSVEHELLCAPARPVVLLTRRIDATVAGNVAPGQRVLGLMLPSSPLHYLLLDRAGGPLVMTSGNRSGDPVVTDDRCALETLGDVADLFLVHDRPIAARCDDSVVHVAAGASRTLRRARGFVPAAIPLSRSTPQPVLALGGHLKNTVCLMLGHQAHLSPHVGDLDTPGARRALREAVDGILRASRVTPAVLAHDLHPEYASTRFVDELAPEWPHAQRVSVQHHHAHIAACVAEHGETEAVIGVAFDGAGLGTDGAIWGGEFLLVEGARFTRHGHLGYVPLVGGDAMARHPWRSATVHLAAAGMAMPRPDLVDEEEWRVFHQLVLRTSGALRTSSAGRLFDAVASVLDVCHVSRFEGEAAMALQTAADPFGRRGYTAPVSHGTPWTVDVGALVAAIADDHRRGVPLPALAGAFHHALGEVMAAGCARIRDETGISVVALGGGVFANALLLSLTVSALQERGFRVLAPREVPCNDGGLSFGQANVAARALEEDVACA